MLHYNALNEMMRLNNFMETFFVDVPAKQSRRNRFADVTLEDNENDTQKVTAILPGLPVEDLTIELDDDILTLKGERKSDREEKSYLRAERQFGSFSKQVHLPYRVNRESIKAELKDGILTVKLEKSEDAKARKIEIK